MGDSDDFKPLARHVSLDGFKPFERHTSMDVCKALQRHNTMDGFKPLEKNVSFSEKTTTHELPPLTFPMKRAMFYDQTDIRRFQVQEQNRLDKEAADAMIAAMAQGKDAPAPRKSCFSLFAA